MLDLSGRHPIVSGAQTGGVFLFTIRYLCSGIFLQTITVCPVLESIRVVTGSQRHVTVFAFSCLFTTQCSMTSAEGGGI